MLSGTEDCACEATGATLTFLDLCTEVASLSAAACAAPVLNCRKLPDSLTRFRQ